MSAKSVNHSQITGIGTGKNLGRTGKTGNLKIEFEWEPCLYDQVFFSSGTQAVDDPEPARVDVRRLSRTLHHIVSKITQLVAHLTKEDTPIETVCRTMPSFTIP